MGVLGEGEREPSRCSIGAGEEEEEVCYDGKHWLPCGSAGAGAAVSRHGRGDGVRSVRHPEDHWQQGQGCQAIA